MSHQITGTSTSALFVNFRALCSLLTSIRETCLRRKHAPFYLVALFVFAVAVHQRAALPLMFLSSRSNSIKHTNFSDISLNYASSRSNGSNPMNYSTTDPPLLIGDEKLFAAPDNVGVEHTTRKGSLPPALNPLDPTTKYQHHPIISEYDFVSAPKSKDHLLDWLGTWIDYKYDCSYDTDPVGYGYKLVVPSRRLPCDDFDSKVNDTNSRVEGTLPLVDDEYPEYIDMLQAIKHFNPKENRPFVMVEFGARYGTWSVRTAVAFKQAFPGHQYVIVGVELAPLFCQWMKEHADYNRVKIEVVCQGADATWILDFMSKYSKVDIMDFDIQGSEFDILGDPRVFPVFREKLVSLHIGTHGDDRVPELIANARRHGFYIHMMYPSSSGLAVAGDNQAVSMCEDEARRFSSLVQSQKCKVASPVGPMYIRDGLIGCRNLKFWGLKELDAEAAGPWKWVQAGYERYLGCDSCHTSRNGLL
jgi:hypothetical protein